MSHRPLTIGEFARHTGVSASVLRYDGALGLLSPATRIAEARTTRVAIDHALRCPDEDIFECPDFRGVLTGRRTGQPLREAGLR